MVEPDTSDVCQLQLKKNQQRSPQISLLLLSLLLRGDQIPQGQIIHHILDLFHGVLDRVDALAQNVVLEVEHLEPGMQVAHEAADAHRHGRVTQRHRVDGQPAELVHDADETQQVFFDGDVESVAIFEVDRDWFRFEVLVRLKGNQGFLVDNDS